MTKYKDDLQNNNVITGRFDETHKDSRIREYGIWGNMLYRCNTKTSQMYDNYGGRGINVCERWHHYENFISDMGYSPSEIHSLDRIDNNGDYEPKNCKWATKKEQARNRRNSRKITIDGVEMQIDDYCEKYSVSVQAIKTRYVRGWSNDRIINTPVRKAYYVNN